MPYAEISYEFSNYATLLQYLRRGCVVIETKVTSDKLTASLQFLSKQLRGFVKNLRGNGLSRN